MTSAAEILRVETTQASEGATLVTAQALANEFAKTAVERDRRGGTAKRERDLLRQSGLLRLSIPAALGGAEASWPEVLQAVRLLGRADGSLAHLFGFHHLLLATVRLFGTPAQWEPLLRDTAERAWFWGNALNPLDTRTSIVRRDGVWRVNGTKSFCSGSVDSDMLVISALRAEGGKLAVTAIPTARAGVRVIPDWDAMGQRQTDSGSVELRDVRIEDAELLETPGPLGSVFASLRPCLAQLILANVFLGIAEGAVAEAKRYTRSQKRAWAASGVDSALRDPYVLAHYGELHLELLSARALTDAAAHELQAAWRQGEQLSPQQRGETALAIAAAKVATTRAGLDAATRIFEVMGARATRADAGLDRFWRNLRTHTLHDPVDYKLRELGELALNDSLPTPSFYT